MEQIIKQRQYIWENKLSLNDRRLIIQWYQKGYAVKKIADTLHLKPPTIQYHLKVAGVFQPNKKPTKWGENIKLKKSVFQPERSLFQPTSQTTIIVIGRKLYPHETAEAAKTFQMIQNFPRNYIEYLERAKKRDVSYQHFNPINYGDRRHLH